MSITAEQIKAAMDAGKAQAEALIRPYYDRLRADAEEQWRRRANPKRKPMFKGICCNPGKPLTEVQG